MLSVYRERDLRPGPLPAGARYVQWFPGESVPGILRMPDYWHGKGASAYCSRCGLLMANHGIIRANTYENVWVDVCPGDVVVWMP